MYISKSKVTLSNMALWLGPSCKLQGAGVGWLPLYLVRVSSGTMGGTADVEGLVPLMWMPDFPARLLLRLPLTLAVPEVSRAKHQAERLCL